MNDSDHKTRIVPEQVKDTVGFDEQFAKLLDVEFGDAPPETRRVDENLWSGQ